MKNVVPGSGQAEVTQMGSPALSRGPVSPQRESRSNAGMSPRIRNTGKKEVNCAVIGERNL